MAHIKIIEEKDAPELADVFEGFRKRLGFVPNSALTMAHTPEIARAYNNLAQAIAAPNENLPTPLKTMIAHIASMSAGCMYCAAHTASTTHNHTTGDDQRKIDHLWEYETHELFSEKERATLRFAQAAAVVPNATGPEHYENLRQFYSDKEIVEIVGVIALFGFLNRWNDTLATALEEAPLGIAKTHLTASGWNGDKHIEP